MKFIKKILSFTLVLCICFSLTSCEKATKKSSLIKINLSIPELNVSDAPLIIALNNGYFQEEGLDVKFSYVENNQNVTEEVINGEADIGMTDSSNIVSFYSKNKKDYPVYFASIRDKNPSVLFSRDENAKLTSQDLRGKTILCSNFNDANTTALNYMLSKKKIIPNTSINLLTNILPSNIKSAFESDTGDFAILSLEEGLVLESNSKGKILLSLENEIGNCLNMSFIANESYIKDNPKIIQKFTNAIYKSQIFISNSSSNEITSVIASTLESTDPKVIKETIEKYKDIELWKEDPIITKENYNKMIKLNYKSTKKLKDNYAKYSYITNNDFGKKAIKSIPKSE